jgi:predicted dehydrogenase
MTARVALIGANGHGRSHRRAIADLSTVESIVASIVELVAIGDVAPVEDAPPGVPVFDDHRSLLTAIGPDIVIVCTPPHTHVPIAEDALRSGADVLLEKPPVLCRADHRRLLEVETETGRSCQVGFQALGSAALTELLSTIDEGGLGQVGSIRAVGAWKRDAAYFSRSSWVGRRSVNGVPTLDGALANPFAHAVMQVIAIARRPLRGIEVDRYRTRDIEVDDTATLRLSFDGGLRALVAVSLCAEEFVPGSITVTGSTGTAELEYPTDRLRLPGEPEPRGVSGRIGLLRNLVEHRADRGHPLVAPLARTAPFTDVLDVVTAAPVTAIDPAYLREATDLPTPRLVIDGINEILHRAATEVALLSELPVPWAAPLERSPL